MRYALPIALFLLATPGAAKTWNPASGCTPFVTVQMKQCMVGNVAACGEGKSGTYQILSSGAAGPMKLTQADKEGWALTEQSFESALFLRLKKGGRQPYSLSRLLSNGAMEWDYKSKFDTAPGPVSRKGSERLTGKTRKVDGVALTAYRYEETWTESDGGVQTFSGIGYAQAEWRLELSGTLESHDFDGATSRQDNTPVEFIFKGDDGFMSMVPTVGCGGSS